MYVAEFMVWDAVKSLSSWGTRREADFYGLNLCKIVHYIQAEHL